MLLHIYYKESKIKMDNQDLAAERAVLSGIARHGFDAYTEVADIVDSRTFTLEENQILWQCFRKVLEFDNDAQIDGASIISAAKDLGYEKYFNASDKAKHVRSVLNTPIEISTVRRLGAKIKKLQVARLMCEQLDKAKANLIEISGDEPIAQILNLAEQPVFDFTELIADNSSDPIVLGTEVDKFLENIEGNPNASIGVPSGFPIYDEIIGGGFRRKSVSIIGARAKAGKTFFGMNVANHVTGKLNIPVLYLDTEMASTEQLARILSMISEKVAYRHIENGKYLEDKYKKNQINEAKEELKKRNLYYVSIPGQAFEETLAVMRRWVKKHVGLNSAGQTRDCLIVLDYFKVMDSGSISKLMSEYQVLGFMLTSLQAFASRFDVPVLTFIQLNRDGLEKENESAASGSDRITWFCSNFSIFKKKSQEEIAEDGGPKNGNRKLIPVICRHGAGLDDGDYINLFANLDYAKIVEGKTRNQLSFESKEPEERGLTPPEDDGEVVF